MAQNQVRQEMKVRTARIPFIPFAGTLNIYHSPQGRMVLSSLACDVVYRGGALLLEEMRRLLEFLEWDRDRWNKRALHIHEMNYAQASVC